MSERRLIDTETVIAEARAIMASGCPLHGVEADLVRSFVEVESAGQHDEVLGMLPSDVIVREMAFKFGRADIVVFHTDGSATVIEAKDGAKGYSHVVSGIGQAGLYAVQLGMSKGAITRVRRALLWTSTGNLTADVLISMTCRNAGVVSLEWPTMRLIAAVRVAAEKAHT